MPADRQIFECKKCGHCCEGKGGIVLTGADLARLASYLGENPDKVKKDYTEISNGKLKIRSGTDGFCVFFRVGQGCIVHAGKPSVCRAWPFFRGNLIDPESLELARDFCPGIDRTASFEEFSAIGIKYLRDNGLAQNAPDSPHALILP